VRHVQRSEAIFVAHIVKIAQKVTDLFANQHLQVMPGSRASISINEGRSKALTFLQLLLLHKSLLVANYRLNK
jgi:hypothetical protein